jgi:hypothetical protein
MAVRLLLVLAALAVLYGCGQASSPVEKQEKQGGVEQAQPETVTPAPDQEVQREEPTTAVVGNMPIAGVVGESVEGSSFDFRVLDYFVTDHYFYLEDPWIEEVQDAFPQAGKFIVVNYSVTNTSPQTVQPDLRAALHVKAGDKTEVYEESDAAAHPSESYGMELAPRQVELSQFLFDVPQDVEPEVLAVNNTGSYATATASPSAEEIGVIDLTQEEPQGPQPQEVLALQYQYYNMTAWKQVYELFAQESKARVSEQVFVSQNQQDYQRDPVAFTEYSFPTVKIEGDRATMQVVRSASSEKEGEGQERITQEAVLEDEGWRIVMRDEQYKYYGG